MLNYRFSAFVVKTFHQAKRQINIDDEILKKAITWIISHQASDGRFPEPGRVIHEDMQVIKSCVYYVLYVESETSFNFIYIIAVDSMINIGIPANQTSFGITGPIVVSLKIEFCLYIS